jgi:hypothetical protein
VGRCKQRVWLQPRLRQRQQYGRLCRGRLSERRPQVQYLNQLMMNPEAKYLGHLSEASNAAAAASNMMETKFSNHLMAATATATAETETKYHLSAAAESKYLAMAAAHHGEEKHQQQHQQQQQQHYLQQQQQQQQQQRQQQQQHHQYLGQLAAAAAASGTMMC